VTSSKAFEVSTRKSQRAEPTLWTFDASFHRRLEAQLAHTLHVSFPNPKYQADPVGFFREILGVTPWSKQIEILEAVRMYSRVAVCSGHKVSKSHTAAGIALWFYCSYPDARVVMTSTTSRQVDQILWRELRMMRARSGRCDACKLEDPEGLIIRRPCPHSALIEGEQGELARTGLKSADFREIVGFTAREAEAVAGISGRNLLYIADEASGIGDEIFEAIEGNRAGGAKLLMLSNGTRNEGEFYDAFNSKAKHYHTLRVSSAETPNVIEGRIVIPGLATREWVEEKRQEWGEDSAQFKVRVLGLHAEFEDAKIFSVHMIASSERRWHDTPPSGRLFVGLDPAGESGLGDETCFVARRGNKMLAIRVLRGLNDEQHLVHLLMFLQDHRLKRETPVVVLDREGSIGSTLMGRLRSYASEHANAFELISVRASDKAVRRPHVYDRVRDELAANLEAWMRDGGAILEDVKLAAELHRLEWKQAINGKLKLTPKDVLRKELGRSCDRYDATALAVWEPLSLSDEVPRSAAKVTAAEAPPYAEVTFDPYEAANAWGGR
jgi:hypothetical protein